ncbi:nitroreductase family protein [Bacillus cereus AH820]|uniref:Nitroreductase family protein n=1 Tax=Bacillus cereus (strain AH820) TaxID=405535 RepID=B7JRD9_BACC0|nr:nitroreductase family protein [Bacillus cereus AH820]
MTTYTSIANVIKERRSVRTFTDKAVDKELLIELLNDATWAPNHKHREPWNCKLYIGEGRQKLVDAVLNSFTEEERAKRGKILSDRFLSTPAQIVVYINEDPRQIQRDEDYAATCAFMQNFPTSCLGTWIRLCLEIRRIKLQSTIYRRTRFN